MRPVPTDTIVAIATPLGESGLGVLRLSGPDALRISASLFGPASLADAPTHTLRHGWIRRAGVRLDEAVAAVFRAPTSYTGEDVVEFSCHGSPAVLRELLAWCQDAGARLARPGEFTERAYLNGKMDLAQAEAVATLISARSRRAAAAAADQLAGSLSRRVADLRRRIVDLLAEIEANLDFVEENLPAVARDEIAVRLNALDADLAELISAGARGRWLRDGARVVMAGRPNVGKSSLFNALLSEDRAIVSDVPGTTRDLLEEAVQWDGFPLTLVDTAGLRDGGDAVETIGADRARRAQSRADVAVLVIDAESGVAEEDRAILAALGDRPVVVAMNKMDRVRRSPSTDPALAGRPVVETSAVEHRGLAELRRAVLSALPSDGNRGEAGAVVTSERQAERLTAARARLATAREAAADGRSEEAIASDLRAAVAELGGLTGDDVGEAVLDAIFRKFCIGK